MKALLNKLLITAVVFTLGLTTAMAQTVKWDSTYRPGKYVELVAKFKADPKSKNDFVFLGKIGRAHV